MFARFQNTRRRRRSAFTLIELLLVLVILAILAAIVVPKLTGRSEDAKKTKAKTDVSNIARALEMYDTDNSGLPDDNAGLSSLVKNPNNLTTWKGPYLTPAEIPKDPWGNDYIYKKVGTHNTQGIDVYSFGPDGKDNTEDDIGNWTTPAK
jgi:general secretion pathway protein G